ncbi:hypothetical protein J2N90_04230 [Enterobacter asburiae]|jgi:hypothetical protein|nr:hypothetical protein [Enterobacter asburiae]
MEVGSISDWFSTGGTLGTFAVAVAAYRKAPEWLAQKHYDTAHLIIEDSVYKDLRRLTPMSNNYKIQVVALSNSLIKYLNDERDAPENISERLDKIEELLLAFYNLAFSIQINLKSLSRYNFVMTEYTRSIVDLLRNTCNAYNLCQVQLEMAANEVPALGYSEPNIKSQTIEELVKTRLDYIRLNKNLGGFIKSVYEDNRSISDFMASR